MEEYEQNVINRLSEIRSSISEYKSIQEKIHKEKIQLSKLAKQVHKEHAAAEQQAMLLEDCLGHASTQIFRFSANNESNAITKDEAKDKLLSIFQQIKLNSKIGMKDKEINNEIDKMVAQIADQHQLLIKEEECIAKLRDKEMKSRQIETQQYEDIMKQLNDVSDEFQLLRTTNKAKKNQLEKIERSNFELRKNVEKAKEELMKSNNILKQTRQETRNLTERRQFSQTRSTSLLQNEDRLNRIRNENAKLSSEEVQLNENLGKLSVEFEEKKGKLLRIFGHIENIEESLEIKLQKNQITS